MAVTIKDVAREAGVSVSTVSKVINGHYSISVATAERVRETMRALSYYPNASAQSFARGATRRVVLLAALHRNVAFENPHMFEIFASVEETLRRRGYALELRGTDKTDASGEAEEIIARREADALVIHVSVMSHALSALLTEKCFPHIILGVPGFPSQVCWVDINHVYSGILAASHLTKQGYRRVAFLGGRDYDLSSTDRLEGVRKGLEDAGIPINENFIWLGDSTLADGQRMTGRLLDRSPRPDAVICANNYLALGCVEAIRAAGLRVPEDIGVMTFDDYPFSQQTIPPLTTVDIDVRDMGAQAADLLLSAIRHPNKQVQMYITTSNLIERGSTAPVGRGSLRELPS